MADQYPRPWFLCLGLSCVVLTAVECSTVRVGCGALVKKALPVAAVSHCWRFRSRWDARGAPGESCPRLLVADSGLQDVLCMLRSTCAYCPVDLGPDKAKGMRTRLQCHSAEVLCSLFLHKRRSNCFNCDQSSVAGSSPAPRSQTPQIIQGSHRYRPQTTQHHQFSNPCDRPML